MSRTSEKGTRVDVMFTNDMYEAIQQVAIKEGAKTHHISKKVEVSPTIARLVGLGLEALQGRLPNKDEEDNLPDKLSDIITDKVARESFDVEWEQMKIDLLVERERIDILKQELMSKGIIDSSPHQPLPDKTNNLPDNLSVKNVMISDREVNVSVSLSDTQNIPSDDLSNSDPVAEDVSIIQGGTDIENHSPQKESLPTFYSFADFHNFLGLTRPDKRNKANGDIAIVAAEEKGYGNWVMNTSSYKFTKTIEG
jgi:hypothetical protein